MLLMLLIFSTNIFKEHHQLMEIDVFLLNSSQISRVKCIFVSDAHTLTYAQHLLGKNYNGITRRSKNKSTDLTVSVDIIFNLNPFLLRLYYRNRPDVLYHHIFSFHLAFLTCSDPTVHI